MPRLAGFLALTLLLGIAHVAGGESPPARGMAERTLPATVGIRCELDRFMTHHGTGVTISPDGHILTATSVVPPGAKKITKLLKDEGPKSVRAQIQGDELRVSSKSRDDLQTAIALIKGAKLDFAVQFTNYR